MLKMDLHMHTNDDPKDTFVEHSAEQLIDHAAKLGFEVLAITCHDHVAHSKEKAKYAEKKGILLIPGCERTIEEKHTLLYNFTQKEIEKINSFEDLRKMKKKHHLVIAAHPFYPNSVALGQKLAENVDLFDAIECSQFYTNRVNFNKEAVWFAHKHNLSVVGNSDTHALWQMTGSNYSLVDSEKTVEGVLKAIKERKVKLVTKPLPRDVLLNTLVFFPLVGLKKKFGLI